jgi:4-hydroxy-4-methyl-2-oxoglutarate aldolase
MSILIGGVTLTTSQDPPPNDQGAATRLIGAFRPADVLPAEFTRLAPRLLERLRRVPSVSSLVSDVMDDLGWNLAVPGGHLPIRSGADVVIGHAVTIGYLPERHRGRGPKDGKLAHRQAFNMASAGDVVVIDARAVPDASVLGGLAAHAAAEAGVAGCVVDGSVRDLAEIRELGLAIWAAGSTPRSGNLRAEAVTINRPVGCGSVQVRAGDLVVADENGICFVPFEIAEAVITGALKLAAEEASQLSITPTPIGE